MKPLAIVFLLTLAGIAHADHTVTLQSTGLTLTLPGEPADWETTKVAGQEGIDRLSYLVTGHILVFSVVPFARGCSAWRSSRTDPRSSSTFWPAGMVVFQTKGATSITESTCLQLTRGAYLLIVTHMPAIGEQDAQNILAIADAVTFAGGGPGSEPVRGTGGGTERVPMPGTGLAIALPGGAGAWEVSTKAGVASDIDYVVRRDINQPWFQISAFKFRSPASCVTWERRSREDGEQYVASPAYSPVPAFESRAKKDNHFVGTSCLATSRGDYLVLFEYRGANDHDEDALARAATQSMIDSAGGSRGGGVTGTTGTTDTSGNFRSRPRYSRLRVLDAGFTQIAPGDPTRFTGSGGTVGLNSSAVRAGTGVKSAGEFETRIGYDTQAGWTADAHLGFGASLWGPAVNRVRNSMLIATVGAGVDAVGIGNEANPMTFKADGAFYLYFQGQAWVAFGRSAALSGTIMLAERVGENNGSETRYGANLIFRRERKSDIVLGVRYHDYNVGLGASALTASLGLGY